MSPARAHLTWRNTVTTVKEYNSSPLGGVWNIYIGGPSNNAVFPRFATASFFGGPFRSGWAADIVKK